MEDLVDEKVDAFWKAADGVSEVGRLLRLSSLSDSTLFGTKRNERSVT